MELFKGMDFLEFTDKFRTNEDCRKYLAHFKWKDGFKCRKCGSTENHNSQDPTIRRCKHCYHIESATAGTIFHKLKFDLRKAFAMVFLMSTSSKGSSGHNFSTMFSINKNTAWLFEQKVRRAMESSRHYPLTGKVNVDETVIGGKEFNRPGRGEQDKTPVVVAIEQNKNEDGIKRAYAHQIDDYTTNSLKQIFEDHIDKEHSEIETDKWRGYNPLKEEWHITQKSSNGGENFELMHRFIMGLKSWLRGIYHHVSKKYLQHYLDEYCYRFNRSIHKKTAFNNLLVRCLEVEPVPYQVIYGSSQ